MSKVLIYIESSSIGDTVAAVPYVSKFQEVNPSDEVYVSINDSLIKFLSPEYPNLNFLGKTVDQKFDKVLPLGYRFDKPVQLGYAEQLGFINAPYLRPKIAIPAEARPIQSKYITIGVHSTAQLKYWNHPSGQRVQPDSPNWNELCAMIRKAGYTPVVIEHHELFGDPKAFNGLPKKANKKFGMSLAESMNYIYHSEFYIGLSSGMAWIAHALGKPVAMIANFTEDWNEFDLNLPDYIRITNKSVCHGCWNKSVSEVQFDSTDWYWCPKHKGTDRQFECHTSITPEQVFNEIKKWIN